MEFCCWSVPDCLDTNRRELSGCYDKETVCDLEREVGSPVDLLRRDNLRSVNEVRILWKLRVPISDKISDEGWFWFSFDLIGLGESRINE